MKDQPRGFSMIPVIGKPVHYRFSSLPMTACGRAGVVSYFAYDPRDVNCLKCRRSLVWRRSMGKP